MTDDELKAIRTRCDAATPGPWRFGTGGTDWPEEWLVAPPETRPHDQIIAFDDLENCVISDDGIRPEDAAFITRARMDVPAMLDDNKRLRVIVEALLALEAERLTRCTDDMRAAPDMEKYLALVGAAGAI